MLARPKSLGGPLKSQLEQVAPEAGFAQVFSISLQIHHELVVLHEYFGVADWAAKPLRLKIH
jgi:hypothetical protein